MDKLMTFCEITELEELQSVSVEEQKKKLLKVEQDEKHTVLMLSFYASVANIIPNLDDKSKISGPVWFGACVSPADIGQEVSVVIHQGLTIYDHPGNKLERRIQVSSFFSVLQVQLCSKSTVVASLQGLPLILTPETRLQLILFLGEDLPLNAVNQAVVSPEIWPCLDHASFNGVQSALIRAMLTGESGFVPEAGIAPGNQSKIDYPDNIRLEQLHQLVEYEVAAVGTQSLVVNRKLNPPMAPRLHRHNIL